MTFSLHGNFSDRNFLGVELNKRSCHIDASFRIGPCGISSLYAVAIALYAAEIALYAAEIALYAVEIALYMPRKSHYMLRNAHGMLRTGFQLLTVWLSI